MSLGRWAMDILIYSLILKATGPASLNVDQKCKVLLNTLPQMTSLTNLTIAYPHCDEETDTCVVQKSLQLVNSIWMVPGIAERLVKLELSIPLETFGQATSAVSAFPRLEHLGLIIHAPNTFTSNPNIVGAATYEMAQFINDKCPNIHSLALTFYSLPDNINPIHPFFTAPALDRLPHLRSFSLKISIINFKLQECVSSFLATHASTIRELHIALEGPAGDHHLPHPQPILAHPIFDVSFPYLSSLTLGLVQWNRDTWGSIVIQFLTKYLIRHRSTLRNLRIDEYIFTFEQLSSFMDKLATRCILQSLSLNIQLHSLSSDLLQSLYTSFGHLRSLHLAFDYSYEPDRSSESSFIADNITMKLCGPLTGVVAQRRSVMFHNKITHQTYLDWALCDLDLEYRKYENICEVCYHRPDPYRSFETSSAGALPAVLRPDGVGSVAFDKIPTHSMIICTNPPEWVRPSDNVSDDVFEFTDWVWR
ncbi:hypothetical protein CVT24_008860 [Panaeolus cyanescens]|uniref:F-box domain-containing protein n=1 Tax=Panaeolus cyanescens TaxID=181874 RepID=A0A409VAW6_9AGAR|nr:hypothetical protein CVT24_008860 [Panaeolus cyanescens]